MTEHQGLAAALVAFQEEAPSFKKTKTARVQTRGGGEYSYKYADLGDILHVVGPLLAKHGLAWSSRPSCDESGFPTLAYRLLHASGEADNGEMPLGVERGCKPQELGSALTYARRYALTAQLNLATDEDDDAAAAQHSSRSQRRSASQPNGEPQQPSEPQLDDDTYKALVSSIKQAKVDGDWVRWHLIGVGVQDVPEKVTPRVLKGLSLKQANEFLGELSVEVDQRNADGD